MSRCFGELTPLVLCLINLYERCFKIDLAFFDGKAKMMV